MTQNNTITHIEIPAPDLGKAVAFYSGIFNWQIQVMEGGTYAFFRIGDTNSGGGFDSTLLVPAQRTGCQIVVDVDDIASALDKIVQAGGSITLPKTEIGGGHGFYACFRDPNGNEMQIHARS